MGYQTKYEITRVESPSIEAFGARLAEICDLRFNGSFDRMLDESMKWYEHDSDIARAMLDTQTIAVDLSGSGEENGDRWDKEFRVIDGEVFVSEFKHTFVRAATATPVCITVRR